MCFSFFRFGRADWVSHFYVQEGTRTFVARGILHWNSNATFRCISGSCSRMTRFLRSCLCSMWISWTMCCSHLQPTKILRMLGSFPGWISPTLPSISCVLPTPILEDICKLSIKTNSMHSLCSTFWKKNSFYKIYHFPAKIIRLRICHKWCSWKTWWKTTKLHCLTDKPADSQSWAVEWFEWCNIDTNQKHKHSCRYCRLKSKICGWVLIFLLPAIWHW